MKRITLAVSAALALVSCAETEARVARPALWKVADADTTIYLFGTIHLLPQALQWDSPKIEAAIKGSQGLVLETVLDKDPAKTGAILMQLGVSAGHPPLLARVPEDKRALLAALVKKSGLPMTALDTMETWAAALTLASAGLRDLPAKPEFGAEAVLSKRFEGDGKPVEGLETPAQQLGYFDALPEAAQRTFLVSVAEDDAGARAEFDTMIAAWSKGDTRAIALTFDDELKLSPELAEVLLKRRNANWAEWVEQRLAKPGTVLVAVGAGHLAGAGSVEDLLAKRGIRVSRLQ